MDLSQIIAIILAVLAVLLLLVWVLILICEKRAQKSKAISLLVDEAVLKQLPMRPKKAVDKCGYCASCGYPFYYEANYCSHCGQKVFWKKGNENDESNVG